MLAHVQLGRMVKGSDLDLVVIVQNQAPEELRQALDDAIYLDAGTDLSLP